MRTPALDRLTAVAKAEFLRRIVDLEAECGPARLTVRQVLAGKPAAAVETTIYLQLDSMARHLIPMLYRTGRAAGLPPDGQVAAAVAQSAAIGLRPALTANLFTLVRDVDDYLIAMMGELLDTLPETQVAAVLLEFWRIDDVGFDPDRPENDTDYNLDDGLPSGGETPHDHLADLISDAVVARLMKRDGKELLLAWSDALSLARC